MFVQAKHYHKGRNRKIRLIVWHDMEAPEGASTAENVAHYFATTATEASAHICCDNNSVVECVHKWDTAWASPGANSDGFAIELAGYARQSKAEWRDAFSEATIRNACAYIAGDAELAAIPARWLSDAELADGETEGHTTHAQVTRVFRLSTHTDPGPNFPAAWVMAETQKALGQKVTVSPGRPPVQKNTTLRQGDKGNAVTVIQQQLVAHGQSITVDGDFGPATDAAVRAFQNAAGLDVDGLVGPNTRAILAVAPTVAHAVSVTPVSAPAVALVAAAPLLVCDGDLGPKTITRWQEVVGTPADGVISKPSTLIARVQKVLAGNGFKLDRDGLFGPNTIRALQGYLHVGADGKLGPITVKALQHRLNAGKF